MDFRKAAAEGKIEVLTQHLKAGTKIDEQGGEHNSTALHASAYYGRLEAVKFLIEKNADINARNKHGQTPLDVAWHDQENHDKFDEETREAFMSLISNITEMHKSGAMDTLFEIVSLLHAMKSAMTDNMLERLFTQAEKTFGEEYLEKKNVVKPRKKKAKGEEAGAGEESGAASSAA